MSNIQQSEVSRLLYPLLIKMNLSQGIVQPRFSFAKQVYDMIERVAWHNKKQEFAIRAFLG
jgi:preprotein translocase subunit SecE